MRVDRVVVTGGAGFLGSHVCEALLQDGCAVMCLDNFHTGAPANLANLIEHPRFQVRFFDVTNEIRLSGPVEAVLHLASSGNPADVKGLPLRSLGTGTVGTWPALELARAKGARLVLGSTAEVYGEAEVHPQPEHYWGAVDPVGPGSVHREASRWAEALTAAYRAEEGTDTAIVRIFSTFGPRMRLSDGRAIGTFIRQALRGEPLTVTGDGSQIRSACYVTDLVEGILEVIRSPLPGPINLGAAESRSILQTARDIIAATGSTSSITFIDSRITEPARRVPDITLAGQLLGWRPTVGWEEGLAASVEWARRQLWRADLKPPRSHPRNQLQNIVETSVLQRLPRARSGSDH
jgi:dTDP-glucose 4,6-dehydratase